MPCTLPHDSAAVSGNKALPDPIPYPLFPETIKGLGQQNRSGNHRTNVLTEIVLQTLYLRRQARILSLQIHARTNVYVPDVKESCGDLRMSRSIIGLSAVVTYSQLAMIGCILAKFVYSHTSQVSDQMMRTIVNRSPLLEKLYVRVKKLGKRRIVT